ncbi:MAG: family 20 glycosylhydrolase, partial [bacterium]
YKMNTLMIYLGNRFRFENLPNIAKDRAALSKTEVTEIETFAKDFHIQIIPIIETLTNMEEILLLPEFRDLAEFPGATSITPLKEASYQLLNEIIFEIAAAFHSPYLHIGGRGSHQIGWHASKKEVENNGLDFVLAEHYKRIIEIVQKYDKQVLMSADLILSNPVLLYQLPQDILFIDTKRQINESNLVPEVFKRGDRKYMVAPILSNGQSILPNYFTALFTIKNVIKDGFTSGALGAIAANCNEVNGFTFQENNYYGYAFTAECAWSPLSANLDKFNEKYFTQFYGIHTQEPELIYSLLMDIAEQAAWDEIWQYPFYHTNKTTQKSYKRIYILKSRMQQVLQLIESVSRQSIRHKEDLDYLKFAAEQSAWLGKKIETVNEIAHFSKRFPEIPTNSEEKEIMDLCYQLVEDLNLIEEKLQLHWLRSYQVEHLPQILDLYGLQIDYWQDIITQIQTGQFYYDPLLESQWIYHPVPQKNNLEQNSSHAFFRKTFDVAPGFKKAYLQAIADSYLKVYINGGFLR